MSAPLDSQLQHIEPDGAAEVRGHDPDDALIPDHPQAGSAQGRQQPPGWLSQYARTKKLEYFLGRVPRDARVLEVGCGDGTAQRWARARGWQVTGLDLRAPADIVGDVNEWRALGLQPRSFDVILAFEVVEHGDLAKALHDLLKPGGLLMVTTPVPRMDWACKLMESARVLQRRTGEHTHLTDIRRYPHFRVVERRIRGFVSQWGILTPVD